MLVNLYVSRHDLQTPRRRHHHQDDDDDDGGDGDDREQTNRRSLFHDNSLQLCERAIGREGARGQGPGARGQGPGRGGGQVVEEETEGGVLGYIYTPVWAAARVSVAPLPPSAESVPTPMVMDIHPHLPLLLPPLLLLLLLCVRLDVRVRGGRRLSGGADRRPACPG